MQIVIKIPKEMKEEIDNGIIHYDDRLRQAVINGIPLPKGHSRLIVEPTEEDIAKTIGGQNDFAECIRDSVKAVFDNAPTIIEAECEG